MNPSGWLRTLEHIDELKAEVSELRKRMAKVRNIVRDGTPFIIATAVRDRIRELARPFDMESLLAAEMEELDPNEMEETTT